MKLLDIKNLRVTFPLPNQTVEAVRGISFSLGQERLGIVGESGSGKSTVGRAILRMVAAPGVVQADHLRLQELNIMQMSEREMGLVRGKRVSLVMQDPKLFLNPVMTIGEQLRETFQLHESCSKSQADTKVVEALRSVSIANPERVMTSFPHEMSGGMNQRIMMAMMLIPDPAILIADEPTSSLDHRTQHQVLSVMNKLVVERGMGLLFISHDLNTVADFCDRVLIMYAGRIVEVCDASELHKAKHPYTQGLLNARPSLIRPKSRLPVIDRDPAWAGLPSVNGRL